MSIVAGITVGDFKSTFIRDFPYLPVYSPTKLYNTGSLVYYPVTELFYTATQDGVIGVPPDNDPDDKWQLTADELLNYVLDADIEKAFEEAKVVFNESLFGSEAQVRLGFLYLAAHYLSNDLMTARDGIAGVVSFLLSGRSVGNVSESYSIPQAYLDDPRLAFYTKTGYGLKYLSFILPYLVGNMAVAFGTTQP